jgi:hypothetical protein
LCSLDSRVPSLAASLRHSRRLWPPIGNLRIPLFLVLPFGWPWV